MSLRLIYGRAGTGKSTAILEEIKEKIDNEGKKYIITPEQFSYSMEKNLLDKLGKNSTLNTEVITFNRMSQRISSEIGGNKDIVISKSIKAMLLFDILEKQNNNLIMLKNSENDIEISMQIIKELKKHNIKVQDIEKAIEEVDNPLLKAKMKDIYIIYSSYEQSLIGKYIDEEDILNNLVAKIEKSDMFNNSEIYIDEFAGFTEQEYLIIEKLLKKAKRVTITFCLDNLNSKGMETDIFYWNKKTAKRIIQIAEESGINIEEPVVLEQQYRLKEEELKHLEANIYSIPYLTYDKNVNKINMCLLFNPYDEIDYIAKTIVKLVRDTGLRYRDFRIITSNPEESASLVKTIFKKYNIPIFIDKKDELAKNPVIKYIFSILEIMTKNWSQEAVFTYAKSGFLDLEEDAIFKLENYAIKYGIKGKKWQSEEYFTQADEEIINTKNKIVLPLVKLKDELSKGKNAISITKVLYGFIEENGIYDIILRKVNRLEELEEKIISKEYQESLNILINIFDEIVKYFAEEKMTLNKYEKLLKTAVSYKELGNIPEAIDKVILGDIGRSKTQDIKCAFILDVNDGNFPIVRKSEGFLGDSDRENLKLIGIETAKSTRETLYEDQFNIYKALTSASELIYICYTSTDKEGKALRPSILISKIKKIFPKIKEESLVLDRKIEITTKQATFYELLGIIKAHQDGEKIDEKLLEDLYNWYNNDEEWKEKLDNALKGLEYNNTPENLTKENINKLYGEVLKTSISKLEQYKRCPFSFYLKYGLRLKDVERYEIKSIDTGTFMHEVIAEFFTNVKDIKTIEEDEISEIVEEIIDDKLKLKSNYLFTNSKKFIILTKRLKKVITQSIKYIVYQLQNSDFEVLANEVEFTKKIDDIEISGKIDRVDISKTGDYIRVIDYKSSSKNIDLNEVMSGLQIQLLTYIDIISEKQKKIPAGALYFNLIEAVINKHKNLTREEIEEELKKEFKMKGLILADVKVVQMMDKTLKQGYSDIVPAYIDKEGNLSKSMSNAVSKEEFDNLQKKVKKIIKNIANEIRSGNIDIKPVYNGKNKTSVCEYCEYKTICAFNPEQNQYGYIQNKTKEQILEELATE